MGDREAPADAGLITVDEDVRGARVGVNRGASVRGVRVVAERHPRDDHADLVREYRDVCYGRCFEPVAVSEPSRGLVTPVEATRVVGDSGRREGGKPDF